MAERGVSLPRALSLHALGLNVLPLRFGTKEADIEWKRLQQQRATEDDIRAWFGNGTPRNIGILLGTISGVVVVETDCAAAEAWIAANFPPTPMRTQSARGIHRYYRIPADRADQTTLYVKLDAEFTIPGTQ